MKQAMQIAIGIIIAVGILMLLAILGLMPLIPVAIAMMLAVLLIKSHLHFIIEWTALISILGVGMWYAMVWAYEAGIFTGL